MSKTEPLHLKYRPDSFEGVIGQKAIAHALEKMIAKRSSQSFLFSGPSGVGKTTMARICAYKLGCKERDIMEIDAATFTGIEAMRNVQEVLQYRPFGESEVRTVIIDECHGLSKQAWDSLLKVLEEPPSYVFWFLCTTNPAKVPETIKTRCVNLMLKPIPNEQIGYLIEDVCAEEKIKLAPGVLDLIVREAHGSARQALVSLAAVVGARDRKDAAVLLRTAVETEPVLALCKFLSEGKGSWAKAMKLVGALEDENPEGIRIIVCAYMGKAVQGADNDRRACHFLSILEAFSTPYNQAEQMAPLMLSIGRVLFGGE